MVERLARMMIPRVDGRGRTVPDLSVWRRGESLLGLQDQEKGAEDGSKEARLLKGVPVKQ